MGSKNMNADQIIRNSQLLLDTLLEQQDEVLAALPEPKERARFCTGLDAIHEQAQAVHTAEDLIRVANAVIALVEEFPALATLFLPEGVQRDARPSMIDWDSLEVQQQAYIDDHRPGFINKPMQLRQKLEASLPADISPADDNYPPSHKTLWQRLLGAGKA
jgi:hypothetical protein